MHIKPGRSERAAPPLPHPRGGRSRKYRGRLRCSLSSAVPDASTICQLIAPVAVDSCPRQHPASPRRIVLAPLHPGNSADVVAPHVRSNRGYSTIHCGNLIFVKERDTALANMPSPARLNQGILLNLSRNIQSFNTTTILSMDFIETTRHRDHSLLSRPMEC